MKGYKGTSHRPTDLPVGENTEIYHLSLKLCTEMRHFHCPSELNDLQKNIISFSEYEYFFTVFTAYGNICYWHGWNPNIECVGK